MITHSIYIPEYDPDDPLDKPLVVYIDSDLGWLARKAKDLKAEREEMMAAMWLACSTREEIAAAAKVSPAEVSDTIEKRSEIATLRKMTIFSKYQEPDWETPLFDVWKVQNKSNATSHPGNSEMRWVDNLLYMYTQPFDGGVSSAC